MVQRQRVRIAAQSLKRGPRISWKWVDGGFYGRNLELNVVVRSPEVNLPLADPARMRYLQYSECRVVVTVVPVIDLFPEKVHSHPDGHSLGCRIRMVSQAPHHSPRPLPPVPQSPLVGHFVL